MVDCRMHLLTIMAIRVRWDQYETALLFDTFWKIEANPTDKAS